MVGACGYHVGGQAETMPKGLRTIAIPPFRSNSDRYKLGDQLAQAISREFISRSHYHVDTDPSTADALLQGSVNNAFAAPTVLRSIYRQSDYGAGQRLYDAEPDRTSDWACTVFRALTLRLIKFMK